MLASNANPISPRACDRARRVHMGIECLREPLIRVRAPQDRCDGRHPISLVNILDDHHTCELVPRRSQHALGIDGPRRRECRITAMPAARELVALGRDDQQVNGALGECLGTTSIRVDARLIKPPCRT